MPPKVMRTAGAALPIVDDIAALAALDVSARRPPNISTASNTGALVAPCWHRPASPGGWIVEAGAIGSTGEGGERVGRVDREVAVLAAARVAVASCRQETRDIGALTHVLARVPAQPLVLGAVDDVVPDGEEAGAGEWHSNGSVRQSGGGRLVAQPIRRTKWLQGRSGPHMQPMRGAEIALST